MLRYALGCSNIFIYFSILFLLFYFTLPIELFATPSVFDGTEFKSKLQASVKKTIKLLAIFKETKRKDYIALICSKARNVVVSEGEHFDGIRVVRVMKDGIECSYKDRSFVIKLH